MNQVYKYYTNYMRFNFIEDDMKENIYLQAVFFSFI